MDLFNALKTTTREVEFTIPEAGINSTGFILTLRADSAPQVQAVRKKFDAMVIEEANKGKKGDRQKALEWFKQARLVAHVAGWRWENPETTYNGEQPEFSEDTLRKILNDGSEFAYFLRNFIEEQVADTADFLKDSGNSSQQQ